VEKVLRLPGVTSESQIGAISYKDDTTVERFRKKGFAKTWRLDPLGDLGITDRCAGLETVQSKLSSEAAEAISARRGKTDVLIVRHILEHAHDTMAFTRAVRTLIKPNGYLVFEVPDCAPALHRGDYTMPWEEHVLYFTPETFQRSLAALGFSTIHYHCYVYANENSLIAIVQPGKTIEVNAAAEDLMPRVYAENFEKYRKQVLQALKEYRERHGKIAIFGAGHLSCAWVNFLHVEEYIEFFVDDHPKKSGMFMPGSRLPIRGSAALIEEKIKLCLLSLSPESETKVLARNQPFVAQGGTFASIFPGKTNSLSLSQD
jgi:C-methyltransferase-like protein/methyltransferase family protein